jgi:PufQ cytochrome subunit
MSDQTANSGHTEAHHPQRTPHMEFYVYFTLIFLAAIPFACIGWVARAVKTLRMPAKNPISRAWADAGAITPSIFRA